MDAVERRLQEPAGVTAESGDWIVGDERFPRRQATLARPADIGSRPILVVGRHWQQTRASHSFDGIRCPARELGNRGNQGTEGDRRGDAGSMISEAIALIA